MCLRSIYCPCHCHDVHLSEFYTPGKSPRSEKLTTPDVWVHETKTMGRPPAYRARGCHYFRLILFTRGTTLQSHCQGTSWLEGCRPDRLWFDRFDSQCDISSRTCSLLIGRCLADDQVVFRSTFEESIRNKSELHSYVRLQCSGNRSSYSDTEDVLFEIRGHPHFIPECETEGSCFFAVAKPYPGRNIAMWASRILWLQFAHDTTFKVGYLCRTQSGEWTAPATGAWAPGSPFWAAFALARRSDDNIPAETSVLTMEHRNI